MATFQTENQEPVNENLEPSTTPGPLGTTYPMELPEPTVETLMKSQEVSDITVLETASRQMRFQGAKEPTPTPRPIAGIHLPMMEEERPEAYELNKKDSTSVHEGSVEAKDSSESSSNQEEEEERILLYPPKPWGSPYKKRYTPSARIITKLIERHHADSDAADAGPMRARRQRRLKATPTTSYIPTSDASAEASADTDQPRRSRKLPLSRLKPKLISVTEAHKAPAMKRRVRPTGMSSKTGRNTRSGNKLWEEDGEWDSKSSSEESDDSIYMSSARKRPRGSSNPPPERSRNQTATSSHTTRKRNNKAKPNREQHDRQTLVCVEIPPWKGSSEGKKPQVSDTEVVPVRSSRRIPRSTHIPPTRTERHSESTNAALIEAHSEEWYTRTFDKWWIEAVVIPLSVRKKYGNIDV